MSTYLDLDTFTLGLKVENDQRTKSEYFMDYCQNYNIIFYAFLKKSIITPQFTRIILFFQYINLFCLLNCLFFFDDMIEFRSKPENIFNIQITITNEYIKFLFSFLISNYFVLLIKIIIRPKSEMVEDFNKLLWTININVIETGK